MLNPRSLTATEKAMANGPLLSEKLPMQLGSFRLTDFRPLCAFCEKHTEPEHIHGKVTEIGGEVHRVNTVSWCDPCERWTVGLARIRTVDGTTSIDYLDGKGAWMNVAMVEKVTIKQRIKRWFGKCWNYFFARIPKTKEATR